MQTALVTGGTGFIGTFLAKKLLKLGWKVNIIDIRSTQDMFIKKRCNIFINDVNKINYKHKCFKNVSVIFHFAAIPSISRKNKKNFIKNNFEATKNLIKCAKKLNIKKFIYSSSSTVYGIPKKFPLTEKDAGNVIGFYGYSKFLAEKLLLKSSSKNFIVSILRPRVVIGPGRLGIFEILFKRMRNNQNIYLIGNGSNYFQFTNIHDFVDASIKCIQTRKSLVINIGSNDLITNYALLNSLKLKIKSKSLIIKTPAIIVKIILSILEMMRLSPLTKEQYTIADKNFFLDTKTAREELGWNSKYSTVKTLINSYDWFKKNIHSNNYQTNMFGIFTSFKNYHQSGFQKPD